MLDFTLAAQASSLPLSPSFQQIKQEIQKCITTKLHIDHPEKWRDQLIQILDEEEINDLSSELDSLGDDLTEIVPPGFNFSFYAQKNKEMTEAKNETRKYFSSLTSISSENEIKKIEENIFLIFNTMVKSRLDKNMKDKNTLQICLFHALNKCNSYISQIISQSAPSTKQREELRDLFTCIGWSAMIMHEQREFDDMSLLIQIINKALNIRSYFNPDYIIPQELAYYIFQKNQAHGHYFGEILTTLMPDENQFACDLDLLLFNKAVMIAKRQQRRTQFISYVTVNHAVCVDIGWNSALSHLEIIALESTQNDSIYVVLASLSQRLGVAGFSHKILASNTGLQKDNANCITYCFALSSYLSHLSFSQLDAHPGIPIELSKEFLTRVPLSQLQYVKQLPVTAFGEKFILMHQSSKAMRADLSVLFGKNKSKIDATIKLWQQWYASKDTKLNYITFRRNSLLKKAQGEKQYTLKQILETTQTEDLGPALRRIAAGYGPASMMNELLSQASPEIIDEPGGKTLKTALHWAYQNGKIGRAQRLLSYGADPNLKDVDGRTPEQCYDPQKIKSIR